MSRLRNSPRLRKGAIVAIEATSPTPTVIAFQYNPETLKRSLKPHMSGQDGSQAEVQRVDAAPTETISVAIELDATDGMEERDPVAVGLGVYPQLAALEILMYPPKSRVTINNLLAQVGVLEIVPPLAPLTLFVWGPMRVLPVRVESLSVEESAYDERLNPIQAKVDLELRVLSYADFNSTDPGSFLYLAHQGIKEALASVGAASSIGNIF